MQADHSLWSSEKIWRHDGTTNDNNYDTPLIDFVSTLVDFAKSVEVGVVQSYEALLH